MSKIDVKSEEVQRQLRGISSQHLDIGSFELKNMDRFDFREVGKASVQSALEAAFLAGVSAAKQALNK